MRGLVEAGPGGVVGETVGQAVMLVKIGAKRSEMIGGGDGRQVRVVRPEHELDVVSFEASDGVGDILRARVVVGSDEGDIGGIVEMEQEVEIRKEATKEKVARMGVGGGPLDALETLFVQKSGAAGGQIHDIAGAKLHVDGKADEEKDCGCVEGD